jgi:FMN reductase
MTTFRKPRILGIGGTAKAVSSTEQALRIALSAAERAGAEVSAIGGDLLSRLPHYGSPDSLSSLDGAHLIESIRLADGLILASPGYHGSISGLVKNAIDYIEETSRDERVYLDGMPIGLIATSYGWQAGVNTLGTLRVIVHALRGWPTPFGVALNTSTVLFENNKCLDSSIEGQLETVGRQVQEFAAIRLPAAPR